MSVAFRRMLLVVAAASPILWAGCETYIDTDAPPRADVRVEPAPGPSVDVDINRKPGGIDVDVDRTPSGVDVDVNRRPAGTDIDVDVKPTP
jgi:hypothetical protein